MQQQAKAIDIESELFKNKLDFKLTALTVFQFQYKKNAVYKKYVDALGVNVEHVNVIEKIPFLPIRFFKTHQVTSTHFEPEIIFESSGTTETINSEHLVKHTKLYEKSFFNCFESFYGEAKDWCIIGLLPSYLERTRSSLVYMVQKLIEESAHEKSGFYLYNFDQLAQTLQLLELRKQKTLLIGVTFALLDFADRFQIPLKHTVVMETGGMKGRKKEMIRAEVHDKLKQAFNLDEIHSEYGMTELLSQAYSKGKGLFQTPNWMRVLLRDEEDPLTIKTKYGIEKQRGLINIIDLANLYSCSFIATDDVAVLHPEGTFEVTGRMDNSDLRGCSLLTL